MEKKQPGAILMVVGGALMVVGSFLTWLTAKIDLVAFADAIKKETGVDIGGLPGFSSTPNSSLIAGTKGLGGEARAYRRGPRSRPWHRGDRGEGHGVTRCEVRVHRRRPRDLRWALRDAHEVKWDR